MFLFNMVLGILLLALIVFLLLQPVCPRCGRLWPERTHAKKLWADALQPVPRLYRSPIVEGGRFYVEYIQVVIYQCTYRCPHESCSFTWNQFERVVEVVERAK